METALLQALRTFVEVARLGSMKAAAARLHVTPGAISQRVRHLETHLGRKLFKRAAGGLVPTAAGRALFNAIDGAFATIDEAVTNLAGPARSRRLVISAAPSFAANWLVPRLGAFAAREPDVEIELESETRLVDFDSERVDLGIRHGLGRYPGLESTWLMAPALIVVASPALIAQGPSVRTAEDCLAYPLLQEPQRSDWRLWFQAQGIETDTAAAGPAFADDDLLIGAAVAGQGLALVRELYAADEIDAGRLVQPLDTRWPARFAYYLVGRPSSFRSRAVRAFRNWLVDTARQDDVRTEPRSHQPA